MPATANAPRSRDALDAAAFTHRGFHCYPRHAPDPQGQGVAVVWQVKTVTRDAAAGYHAATGEWLSMVDFGPVTAADLRAQIDDVLLGFAAEKVVHADGSASIVSPSTGQVYGRLTPAEQTEEAAAEQRALSEQQERQAAKAARELAREERQATMAAERQAAQDAAAAADSISTSTGLNDNDLHALCDAIATETHRIAEVELLRRTNDAYALGVQHAAPDQPSDMPSAIDAAADRIASVPDGCRNAPARIVKDAIKATAVSELHRIADTAYQHGAEGSYPPPAVPLEPEPAPDAAPTHIMLDSIRDNLENIAIAGAAQVVQLERIAIAIANRP